MRDPNPNLSFSNWYINIKRKYRTTNQSEVWYIPEGKPLWNTKILRYESALEAHNNLEAMLETLNFKPKNRKPCPFCFSLPQQTTRTTLICVSLINYKNTYWGLDSWWGCSKLPITIFLSHRQEGFWSRLRILGCLECSIRKGRPSPSPSIYATLCNSESEHLLPSEQLLLWIWVNVDVGNCKMVVYHSIWWNRWYKRQCPCKQTQTYRDLLRSIPNDGSHNFSN